MSELRPTAASALSNLSVDPAQKTGGEVLRLQNDDVASERTTDRNAPPMLSAFGVSINQPRRSLFRR